MAAYNIVLAQVSHDVVTAVQLINGEEIKKNLNI